MTSNFLYWPLRNQKVHSPENSRQFRISSLRFGFSPFGSLSSLFESECLKSTSCWLSVALSLTYLSSSRAYPLREQYNAAPKLPQKLMSPYEVGQSHSIAPNTPMQSRITGPMPMQMGPLHALCFQPTPKTFPPSSKCSSDIQVLVSLPKAVGTIQMLDLRVLMEGY